MKKETIKKETTKKVTTKKVTPKKKIPKKVTPKKVVKPRKKEVHLCFKCLNEIDPHILKWVSVTNKLGMSFQIPICEDCIEHREDYIHLYEKFEVRDPLYKKRVYKKLVKKDA